MFKIEQRKKMHGWMGMNYYAAKKLHVPFHHIHRNVIEINSSLNPKVRHGTEKHEEIEYHLIMRGKSYPQAHKLALKYEKSPHRVSTILRRIK